MKKVIILSFIIMLISGCDITYNLEIKNDGIIETKYIWYDKEITHNPYDYTKELLFENGENGDFLFPYGYKYKNINNGNKVALKITKKYQKFDDYKNMGLYYASCFEEKNIEKDKDYIYIDLSGKFSCYQYLTEMDTFTLSIKTNHKVKESNSNTKNNNTYSWKITKENAGNTDIHLKLYSDKYVYNYDNVIFKRLGIVFLIICVTIVIGLFAKRIVKKYQINSNRL